MPPVHLRSRQGTPHQRAMDPFLTNPQIEESDPFDDMTPEEIEEVMDIEDDFYNIDDYYDDASALASAGWGTDEDYGTFEIEF